MTTDDKLEPGAPEAPPLPEDPGTAPPSQSGTQRWDAGPADDPPVHDGSESGQAAHAGPESDPP
ncbi:MAG: ABC transporter, partial [Deltaproteobacteria bacterium]|nr:ABC transporter [Deltaproteobacteria bacterium]